ncbi:MAG: hypothetical protein HFF18_04705 [Oscillospiraceae bacterium]|nr:hypothetical protein [Oscillospiraceae bacterium]
MKKRIPLLAALCAALMLSTLCWAQAASLSITRTTSSLFLNDHSAYITGFNINGNNYFRIRDLAKSLNGTSASFEVTWNASANQVELLTGQPYTGEAESSYVYGASQVVPSTAQLMIDGQTVDVAAYNIAGNNYYKLRDLSGLLGYEVFWLEAENAICLYTGLGENARLAETSGGQARQMTANQSTARWAETSKSYLFDNGGGTFTVLDASGDSILLDTYDSATFALTASRTLPAELDLFGGFFAGEQYNYLVFGQANEEENDRKEVIRVVKYSKDFQRLDSVSITGGDCVTTVPFDAGSLRMAEHGSELVIHTARERYLTEDGLNHQSQLTILLDTETMEVQNDLGWFQDNHVGHSFNQFVQYDGGRYVLIDHGDAYPRSVTLYRSGSGSGSPAMDLLPIPGRIGANCTGVTLGGFELSEENYLVAINTIDHSKVTEFDSFGMHGLEQDERDISLLVCGKDARSTEDVRQISLTGYIDQDKLGSTPYLVKLSGGRFLVLWEEYAYENSIAASQGLRYAFVDGEGRMEGSVQTLAGARLSADCQPIVMDGAVVWYINQKAGRMFYQIPV